MSVFAVNIQRLQYLYKIIFGYGRSQIKIIGGGVDFKNIFFSPSAAAHNIYSMDIGRLLSL